MYATRVRPDYSVYNRRPRTPRTPRPASDKQLAFLAKLLEDKEVPAVIAATLTDALANPGELTTAVVSGYIDALMAMPRKVDPDAPATATEIGYYERDGQLYKVQENRQGTAKYAKVLRDGSWEYAPGAMRTLLAADLITAERAKEIRSA